jgi:hypothetical protein
LAVEVAILHKKVDDIMNIVRSLRSQGLVQGVDFDFAYRQQTFDPINGHSITDRHTVFTFYTEKYATLFALKWS